MPRSTDQQRAEEEAQRREELIRKVREANRQSASRPTGPPSPDLPSGDED
ncbi:hypothetical protein [Streptomyces melanogenes]|uniref:Small hydrophilic protein n=1 Tax=Streptomyces melanogenes TaxID=67326 RepID=A0ABZ1XKY2_9ACTN|nr:hypothetical protein [Streptomyces melanogenes]